MPDDGQTRSAKLFARAQRVMPGGNTRTTVFMRPHPAYAAEGGGAHVIDVDGVARIDLVGNFTSLIHGHAHPALVAAATEQIRRGTCFGMPTENEIVLAEILCGRLKGSDTIRFTNSGTEAVMMAIKAARAATGRSKIAKCEGAYHGSYDAAEVSQNSAPDVWGEAEAPQAVATAAATPRGVLDDVVVIPFNKPDVAAGLLRVHGPELAAILVDPMPSRAGLVPATQEYLSTLRDLAWETGALLVFDEVIAFRLGPAGAQGLFGIEPDLTVLGKFIGGGFAIGAVAGRAEVMRVFDPSAGEPLVPHGGTFSANPVSMAAGIASMHLLTAPAYDHLDRLGERLTSGLKDILKRRRIQGQVTGLGSLRRLHFRSAPLSDFRSTYPSPIEKKMMGALVGALFRHGVIISPSGMMALCTPMTEADVASVIDVFDDALAEAARVC
jgi:glutamate-1-semialdehyde 2,1-aminomutase